MANVYFCGAPNRLCPNATLSNCPAARFDSALKMRVVDSEAVQSRIEMKEQNVAGASVSKFGLAILSK